MTRFLRPRTSASKRPTTRRGVLAALLTFSLIAASPVGAAAAVHRPSQANLTASTVHPLTLPEGWGTTWSLNEFNPNYFSYFDEFVLLPLALPRPPSLNAYIPQLATSWSVTGKTIAIHLRTGVKWQNGAPFTSADVLTTLLLEGTNGSPIWGEISNVTTPSSSSLAFTLRPKQGAAVALSNILNITPVPDSQYKQFLVPGLEQDLLSYNSLVLTKGLAVANNSSAGTTITSVFNKVEKYAPPHLIGNGPFKFSRMNSSDSIVVRSPTYWDAAQVHVPAVEFTNVPSNAAIYGGLFSHLYDWSTGAAPFSIIHRWKNSPETLYALPPTLLEVLVLFNSRRYPLNELKVRQAIAYLVNRKTVNRLEAGGGDPTYTVSQHPDGLPDALQSLYLSHQQLSSLNAYKPDPAKATELLRSLHLRKVNGRWLLPDGKPFKLTVIVPSGQNDSIAQMTSVADQLTAAGIASTLRTLSPASYGSAIHAGQFELAWSFGGSGLDPLAQLEGVLVEDAPQALGAYKGEPGIGFQADTTVPGLGRVNVVQTLEKDAAEAGTHNAIAKLTWDWVQMTNRELPYLDLSAKGQQVFYSSSHYTDWPSLRNPLWALVGYINDQGLAVLIEHGYVRPKVR